MDQDLLLYNEIWKKNYYRDLVADLDRQILDMHFPVAQISSFFMQFCKTFSRRIGWHRSLVLSPSPHPPGNPRSPPLSFLFTKKSSKDFLFGSPIFNIYIQNLFCYPLNSTFYQPFMIFLISTKIWIFKIYIIS